MSKKDMLGPLTRALVGVATRHLGIMLAIADRLSTKDGEEFCADLKEFNRQWKNRSDIVRSFEVDRKKAPERLFAVFGRNLEINFEVLKTMPTDGPSRGKLYFFCLRRNTPVDEIQEQYRRRRLVPDYLAQIQVNLDNPTFASEYKNAAQWDGCSSTMYFVGNDIGVGKTDYNVDWEPDWWFAGRPKAA